jgi:hypothetical protein
MRASTSLFAVLAALATSAFAKEFTLNSVEPIEKSEVPSDCYKAYTAPLPGCGGSTNTCSSKCVDSINSASALIQSECANAFVGMDSLMRRTLDGGLLTILCPDAVAEIVESTLVAPSLLSTTIYAPLTKATGSVASEIEMDTSAIAAAETSTAVVLALDTAPTPTAGISGSNVEALFASETASASESASGAAVSGVDTDENAANGGLAVGRWAVVGVAAVVGVVMMV